MSINNDHFSFATNCKLRIVIMRDEAINLNQSQFLAKLLIKFRKLVKDFHLNNMSQFAILFKNYDIGNSAEIRIQGLLNVGKGNNS